MIRAFPPAYYWQVYNVWENWLLFSTFVLENEHIDYFWVCPWRNPRYQSKVEIGWKEVREGKSEQLLTVACGCGVKYISWLWDFNRLFDILVELRKYATDIKVVDDLHTKERKYFMVALLVKKRKAKDAVEKALTWSCKYFLLTPLLQYQIETRRGWERHDQKTINSSSSVNLVECSR